MLIGHDYPRPYASISITHVEGYLPPALATKLQVSVLFPVLHETQKGLILSLFLLQEEKNRRLQGISIKKLLKTVEKSLG